MLLLLLPLLLLLLLIIILFFFFFFFFNFRVISQSLPFYASRLEGEGGRKGAEIGLSFGTRNLRRRIGGGGGGR